MPHRGGDTYLFPGSENWWRAYRGIHLRSSFPNRALIDAARCQFARNIDQPKRAAGDAPGDPAGGEAAEIHDWGEVRLGDIADPPYYGIPVGPTGFVARAGFTSPSGEGPAESDDLRREWPSSDEEPPHPPWRGRGRGRQAAARPLEIPLRPAIEAL